MRKKKKQAPVPAKPGKSYQHLIDFYKSPPDNGTPLKKGHVLFMYCKNDKSATKTVRAVSPLLPSGFSTSCNKIQSLGTRYHSFKKPSEESEWKNFTQFCDEQFVGVQVAQSPGPSVSMTPSWNPVSV